MNFALLSILSLVPALPAQDEPLEPIPEANAALYDAQSALADWRIQKYVGYDSIRGRKLIEDLALAAEAVARTLGSEPAVDHLHDVWFEQLQFLVERGYVNEASGLARRLEELEQLAGEEAYAPLARAAKTVLARDDSQALIARIPSAVRVAATSAGVQQAEDVVIANAVRDAVARDAMTEVLGLGSRAVPTLVEIARGMAPTPAPTESNRAFKMLLFADRAAALDLAVELAERESYLVRKRLADALVEVRAFDDIGLWEAVGDDTAAPRNPAWIGLVETLTSNPGVEAHVIATLLSDCLRRGHMPESVTKLAFEVGIEALPNRGTNTPSPLAVVRRAIEDPRDNVREWGLSEMLKMPNPTLSTEIARLSDDPSPRIRRMVAQALRPRDPVGRRGSAGPMLIPIPNESTRSALAGLIADSDALVRNAAIASVRENIAAEQPLLDAATLRDAAKAWPDEDVREVLYELAMTVGSPDEDAKTIAAFMNDPSPALREYPFFYLQGGAYAQDDPETFWRMVDEHYADDREKLQKLTEAAAGRMRGSEAWRESTLDWLTARGDREAWKWAWIPRTFPNNWIDALDDDRLVEVLRASYEAGARLEMPGVKLDPEPWLALAASDAEPRLRILAARFVIQHRDRIADGLAQAVDAIAAQQQTEDPWDVNKSVRSVFQDLRRLTSLKLSFLSSLLEDPRIPMQVIDPGLFHESLASGVPDLERARYFDVFTERFPPSRWDSLESYEPLNLAFACTPADVDSRIAMFEAALFCGHGLTVSRCTRLVAQLRDPRVLAALNHYVDEGRTAALPELAELASSYLTDEAAEIILAAAALAPDADRRAKILASLDQVTAYQDAKARWQRRTDAAAKRVEAIDALIAIADDAAQPVASRAEALRGLALLEAVEELPRLVRALSSEEAAIRDAARAALDRLNDA